MKSTFHFTEYTVTGDEISFGYRYIGDSKVIGEFIERYKVPVPVDPTNDTVAYILRMLHLIVGISYYKSLRGDIALPYDLSDAEAEYLNNIYDYGLGEYAYINKLTQPIRPFLSTGATARIATPLTNNGAILGVGGGKDSIVAGEILKAIGIDTTTMDIATRDHHGQAGAVMDIMGLPQLRVERYLDTAITDFTKQYDGQNGHVPLSVILAWIGILMAGASGKKYVAMANEAGTSTGNTVWNGREVNHQWAKSLQQESLTQDFVHAYVSPDIDYFSPIRPYSSLAIMELLAKVGRPYLTDFTSCNLVLRIDPASRPNGRWCTHCAKCLSSWLLLSSWLTHEELITTFGRDLWADESLRPTLDTLLGLAGHKPLDCVGTIEELRAVTRLALTNSTDAALLKGLGSADIPGPDVASLVASRSSAAIPDELEPLIEQFVTATL